MVAYSLKSVGTYVWTCKTYDGDVQNDFLAQGKNFNNNLRARLDDNTKLLEFTEKLEAACVGTVESGKMTKDIALIIHGSWLSHFMNTENFIDVVVDELKARLASKLKKLKKFGKNLNVSVPQSFIC
ncbi:predicted protein [Arabidopsis lyrata subsp. lyrata]|uniref:Predicted protein n=1 Tax=Arabidopsis lyrata subsp. lyrata TaxID=81972 RepID=D7KT19_ARALL|nr:predicted protein [Arabidopsis lyrata subsp. lyrata]